MDEPEHYTAFRSWLASVGVELHPALRFHNDPVTGWGLFVADEQGGGVPAETKVLRMPAALGITPLVARTSLAALCRSLEGHAAGQEEDKDRAVGVLTNLDQRDTVILYLILSRCLLETSQAPGQETASLLSAHLPYIRVLADLAPSSPISYTPTELSFLQHTSLGASIPEKQANLSSKAETTRTLLNSLATLAKEATSRDGAELNGKWFLQVLRLPLEKLWEWGEYCYSSRAFPATMVYPGTQRGVPIPAWNESRDRSSSQREQMAPILLPGLDSFNHQRRAQVVWHVGRSAKPYPPNDALFARETRGLNGGQGAYLASNESAIAFQVLDAVQPGAQVFNNYGPKGNEELLFSYGFTVPGGPDDYVRLSLPVPEGRLVVELSQNNTSQLAKAAEAVAMLHGYESEPEWEKRAYTDVAHMLGHKLAREESSLERARSEPVGPEVRESNLHNIITYLDVQCKILAHARRVALDLASAVDDQSEAPEDSE